MSLLTPTERFFLAAASDPLERSFLAATLEYDHFTEYCVLAQEGYTINYSVADWFKDLFNIVTRLTKSLTKIIRIGVELITKKYDIIIKLYDYTISKHINDIDEDKFNRTIIRCIPHEVFQQRKRVISKLVSILINMESIAYAPIQDIEDTEAYMTPEFSNGYKELKSIGYEIMGRNFAESASRGYSSRTVKQSIKELGYTKYSLSELINTAKGIAAYSTHKSNAAFNTSFKKITDKLISKEKQFREDKTLEASEREEKLKEIDIRITRLWWVSHFAKVLYTISNDQMNYILRVFRAAENAIQESTEEKSTAQSTNDYY